MKTQEGNFTNLRLYNSYVKKSNWNLKFNKEGRNFYK